MSRTPSELLCRLFEYAEESVRNVEPSRFHLDSHKPACYTPAQLQHLPGVHFNVQQGDDTLWMQVERLVEAHPPEVQGALASTILVTDNPSIAPQLHEHNLAQLILQAPSDTPESAVDIAGTLRQEAQAVLDAYCESWKRWAAVERPRRETISLYGDLFAIKQQMDTEQTTRSVELVWGLGVSAWRLTREDKPFDFQYPLLTQAVELTLNEHNMALEIRPRTVSTRCEMDAFVAAGVQGAHECDLAMRAQLDRLDPASPFEASSYVDVLKMAARSLDGRGRFEEVMAEDGALPKADAHLVVTDAWVLFVRPKPTNYLIDDLTRLRKALEKGASIPDGPLSLVTPPSDTPVAFAEVNFRGLSSRSMGSIRSAPRELYFPLPYNDEQVTIVQRLECAPGVVVQGPPGTGKTHTIANIICHYLANGKRILVTAKGEQALDVLQSKIPEEVRPLTVALLASDREGIRQFQGAVEAIQHKVSQIDPTLVRNEITQLHGEIENTHADLIRIDRRIDEIARQQLAGISVDGVVHSAQDLAKQVIAQFDAHDWFEDRLTLDAKHAPPLTLEQGAALRKARRRLGSDLAYATSSIPKLGALPDAEYIARLHSRLVRVRAMEALSTRHNVPALRGDDRAMLSPLARCIKLIDCSISLLEQLGRPGLEWTSALRCKHDSRDFAAEINVLNELLEQASQLGERRSRLIANFVEFPDEALGCEKTRAAVERGATTGKPFGLVAIGTGDAKSHLSKVLINGSRPCGAEDWSQVREYLTLHSDARRFTSRWNSIAEILEVPRLEGGVQYLRALQQTSDAARDALKMASQYDWQISSQASELLCTVPLSLARPSAADLKTLRGYLAHHVARLELADTTAALSQLQTLASGSTGSVAVELREFIERTLGSDKIEAVQVTARYTELIAELKRVTDLFPLLEHVRQCAQALHKAGAHTLAKRVLSVQAQDAEDDVFPVTWRDAWNWSRIQTHLNSIEARHELIELNRKRSGLETALATRYREVVGKAAWLSTRQNASPKVLAALQGYVNAVRRIGMGTGPNAERYRRDARQCMIEAADAVPCWIMKHDKVSESIPAEIGAFDLVIVDEASQSDLWALPAIVRAKKILVVGDNKQVSPDGGFKSSKHIAELRARFLGDQPFGAEMTPEKSLYDLASRVFAHSMVMLREHFRCVPPIITYSNRFYNNAIQPLRIPRASERIDPPLVDLYVKGAVRSKKSINPQEAEAIVQEIQAILGNPALAGRTLGVVSLLGLEQARHIDTLVRERCPADELIRREFACGDASTFQGSERDIIFLSMVADPEQCHALSGVSSEQRFNVAASRARDRMYLVRSVSLEDLSPKDLRRTLVEYFSSPLVEQKVDQAGLIKLCESGFERDVFTCLVERGYRVIPQVKSGAYRLDMVVEGANDKRLAIECDGDAFHGPDRWEADMNRQRVLERAGWVFWRCFASSWYLNRQDNFEELLQRLSSMGIEPLGALENLPSIVEYREWEAPQEEEESEPTIAKQMDLLAL